MTCRVDPTLDVLLELDGQVLVVDPGGDYWVRFTVGRVPATRQEPHGLDYAMTLHGPDGGSGARRKTTGIGCAP